MRETVLLRVEALLREHCFHVESFAHSNACFDLVAKRPGLALVLKVFNNIDALREDHASELRKIAALFGATVIVVGEKTKAFQLKKGVLYERLGIVSVSTATFRDILNEQFPSVKYFKGKSIVELDAKKLRERRVQLGLTLQELADRIGSTIESVHRYEKGAAASLSTAEKLEDALSASLVTRINLFETQALPESGEEGLFEESFEDKSLGKVHDLGVKVAVFRHAPFKAYTSPGDSVIIGKAVAQQGIQRKAEDLARAKEALQGQPLIISRELKCRHVAEIPVVAEEELDSMSKFKDLMKLIREREGFD